MREKIFWIFEVAGVDEAWVVFIMVVSFIVYVRVREIIVFFYI